MDQNGNIVPDHSKPRSLRRFLLLSVFFASTGRNAYYVGAIWMLAEAVNNDGSIALFLALGTLSEFLTSAPAGHLVDRGDRRWLCAGSDAFRIVILIVTSAALIQQSSGYTLYGSAIFFAAADRLYLTASSAIVPSITSSARLVAFNSLTYIAMQAGNMLAAIATGWLLGTASHTMCFLFSVGAFAISMLSMRAVRFQPASVEQCRTSHATLESSEGKETSRVPAILIISYVLIYVMGMLVSALISKFVLQELEGTSLDFGMLEFCWAAGGIIGMLILTHRRFSKAGGRIIPIIVLSSGVAIMVFYPAQDLWIAIALMIILGAGYNLSRVLIDVEIQRVVSGARLGRAKGWMHAACMGFSLAVYAALAVVGDGIRPSAAFLFFGSGMIVCIIIYHALSFAKPSTPTRGGTPL